jgi:hypothetical protein
MSAAEYRPATALRPGLGKRVPTEASEGQLTSGINRLWLMIDPPA